MPWEETGPMRERIRFISDLESGLYTMTQLCGRYGIARKTGYKWAQRFAREGVEGLKDRSRAPRSCPHKTPAPVAALLVAARRKHPHWGPRKLLAYLGRRHPGVDWPAPSTAGGILKCHGLVAARRQRRRLSHPGKPRVEMRQANDVWTSDYKGEFRLGDGRLCYPLTIQDGYSRFLLDCRGRRSTSTPLARSVFRRAFRRFGLPTQILTDNGTPFATASIGRLSRLSVWWIRLGIQPVLIQPGHPEQNPRHERMHRTLKAETARPPQSSLRHQQRAFDRFLLEYNQQRPHEALDNRTPAQLYQPSPRPYPEKLPAIDYPGHYEVRLVARNGGVKWHDSYIFITRVLSGEYVGLEEIDDGIWSLYFGPIELGRFDARHHQLAR